MARSLLALTAVLALTSCFASCHAALTPSQIVQNIQTITQKSQALQEPANTISVLNAPLIIIGLGPFPVIITGFQEIVTITTTSISQMQGDAPITEPADATAVFNAFREFVRVHQLLLNILIGKGGVIGDVPFVGEPMAQVLRSVEAVVDTIALSLTGSIQDASTSSDLSSQADSLHATLELAIQRYQGLVNLP